MDDTQPGARSIDEQTDTVWQTDN